MGAPRDPFGFGFRTVAAEGRTQSLLSRRQGYVDTIAKVEAGCETAEVSSPGGHALAALNDAVPKVNGVLVHL